MLSFAEKILIVSHRYPRIAFALQAGDVTVNVADLSQAEVAEIQDALQANGLMADPIDTYIWSVIE